MTVAAFPRAWTPRPRLLPRVVEAATKRKPIPNVCPVEHDGSQPGIAMPAELAPIVNPWPSVRAIRRARGMGPEYPCGFPHDLGCITQLYLGLAIRSARPSIGMVAIAEQCLVPVTEAAFFGRLLDIAEQSAWANETPHVIAAAIREMRGQG